MSTVTDNVKYYSEPDKDRPCSRCHFVRYDSSHSEYWCGLSETPQGVGHMAVVGAWGTCDGWVEDEDR